MKKQSFLGSVSVLLIGNILLQGISIITAPIFTRLLTPSDYGNVVLFLTWVGFVQIFIGLQSQNTIYIVMTNEEEIDSKEYMSSIMIMSSIILVVTILVFSYFKGIISYVIKIESDLVILLALNAFFSYVISFYYSSLIYSGKLMKKLTYALMYAFATVLISIFVITLVTTDNFIGRIYGITFSNILFGLYAYVSILNSGKWRVNTEYVVQCLKWSLPLIAHSVSYVILVQSDRVMIGWWYDNSIIGLYAFAYQIGSLIMIGWTAFNSVWAKWYTEKLKQQELMFINTRLKKYLMLFAIFSGIVMINAPEAVKILSSRTYWDAITLVPIIVVGVYFQCIYSIASNFEYYTKNTKWIAIGSVMTALINIGLNYLFIPRFGGLGAAAATAISFIILFLFHNFIVYFIVKGFGIKPTSYLPSIVVVLLCFIIAILTFELIYIRMIITGFILIASICFYREDLIYLKDSIVKLNITKSKSSTTYKK